MALPLQQHAGRTTSTEQSPDKRGQLTLASQRRSRLPIAVLAGAAIVILAGLLSLAVFHTQLASRQLQINQLEQQARDERERFDDLRNKRAVLRSPGRLSENAERLGMVAGSTSDFVEVEQWKLAQQIAAAGVLDDSARLIVIDTDPLEQHSDVKRVSAGQP